MQRFYYISDNVDELEDIERSLETSGIATEQIHILTNDDKEVAKHHLHGVSSFMKKDIVHSTLVGAVIGLIGSILVLVVAALSSLPDKFTWVPFIFLAIIVLGFCTWEGGLWGIQEPNHQFRRFQKVLDHGKHILFVDIDRDQQQTLDMIASEHPHMKRVGAGKGAPKWIVRSQEMFRRFMRWAP